MIDELACIGRPPQDRRHRWNTPGIPPLISDTATIEAFASVDAGTVRATTIGERSWLMKSCHVGHDVIIGDDVIVCPMVSIAGHVEIGDGARLDQGVTVKPFVKIGAGARCGMGAVVIRDVPDGVTVVGNPAKPIVKHQPDVLTESEEQGWVEFSAACEALEATRALNAAPATALAPGRAVLPTDFVFVGERGPETVVVRRADVPPDPGFPR